MHPPMALLGLLGAFAATPTCLSATVQPQIPLKAPSLPLEDVRLTGGPLKRAQELDAAYLLKLEPDRMLYHLRERAGLAPKAKAGYGGWDGNGYQLTGHIAGHYLSAVSIMYAATGDKRFKDRADYIVSELKEIQDAQGDGYIGALMAKTRKDGREELINGKTRFEELGKGVVESGGFDLNGMWSPWYVQHKIYAGLRDAHRLADNRSALDVETKFAVWADRILSRMTEEQRQKMLGTEFGGMNEVLVDLYADTGDKRWLETAQYFNHRAIVEPLAQGKDILAGKHGNTQVPKLYGELVRSVWTGDPRSGDAARFFWDRVAAHHSYATGGHGKDEYFGEPDKLSNRVDGRTSESCNAYNMLKLSRMLFALDPDEKYAAFGERALFNQVLGSIDDGEGRTCYMVPVGRGVTREYQDMMESFTCCVGTGMENHALHGDGIYCAEGDKLYVNLYAPSRAEWKSRGVTLEADTDLPEGEKATIKLALNHPSKFTLALRCPAWADGAAFEVNGQPVAAQAPRGYVEITREWKDGDIVKANLPKTLHLEPLPDNPERVAILWGPLVLAGDLGPEASAAGPASAPVLVTDNEPPSKWIRPVPGKPGVFRTLGAGQPRDVELVPFYRLHHRSYAAYWDIYTRKAWAQKEKELAGEQAKQKVLERATVAYVQPGEMQPERDFNQKGENTAPDRVLGRAGRRARGWFSFEIPVDGSQSMELAVTYSTDEWNKRAFAISVDGHPIAEQTVEKDGAPRFYDVRYAIPRELTKDRKKVTVRFDAIAPAEVAGVFGIRMLRN